MREFWQKNKRKLRGGFFLVLAAAALFYGLCWALSFKAAEIFNRVAEDRDLFPGTVMVERLSADFLGRVSFEGLRWENEEGELLADIPSGSFRVKPWDILTRRVGTLSVTEVTAEGGYVHLFFDDRMQVRFIKPKPGGKKESGQPIRLTGLEGNRKFRCSVDFKNGTLEAESPDRHFTIHHVNLRMDADTERELAIKLSAGPFDGSVAAEGLRLDGHVRFTERPPVCDFFLKLEGCVPASLGAGVNIENPATLSARVGGTLPRPEIDGTLTMERLDLPSLPFTEVSGELFYADGKLSAENVKAKVYGGDVTARGMFDFDKKSYDTEIHGRGLRGGIAARDIGLRCEVALDMTISSDGTKDGQEIDGTFSSGTGRYHTLPFEKISGSFDRRSGVLSFHDVIIKLAMGEVRTDAFRIRDGKVELGEIYLTDALSGRRETLRK